MTRFNFVREHLHSLVNVEITLETTYTNALNITAILGLWKNDWIAEWKSKNFGNTDDLNAVTGSINDTLPMMMESVDCACASLEERKKEKNT